MGSIATLLQIRLISLHHAAERKLREIRKRAEDLGLKFVMYTPETFSISLQLECS